MKKLFILTAASLLAFSVVAGEFPDISIPELKSA